MFLGFIGVATVIVCILLGRYNRERVAREWDMNLGRRMHESVDALERRCHIDRMMADDSWDAAWDAMVTRTGWRSSACWTSPTTSWRRRRWTAW